MTHEADEALIKIAGINFKKKIKTEVDVLHVFSPFEYIDKIYGISLRAQSYASKKKFHRNIIGFAYNWVPISLEQEVVGNFIKQVDSIIKDLGISEREFKKMFYVNRDTFFCSYASRTNLRISFFVKIASILGKRLSVTLED